MAKLGMSFLICSSSMWAKSLFFIGLTFSTTAGGWFRRPPPAARQRLFFAPPGNGLVIAAQEHLGNGHAAKDPRPGVLRIFDRAGYAVRFLLSALGVPEDTGDITN